MTLYHRVADDLRQSILKGEMQPGDPLPSEVILRARYGCSQGTVRQALRILRDEGLVSPQQGRGVFVRAPNSRDTRLLAQAEILEEVARWSEQPNEPTGCYGVLSAHDLRMRAVALRTMADTHPDPKE